MGSVSSRFNRKEDNGERHQMTNRLAPMHAHASLENAKPRILFVFLVVLVPVSEVARREKC